MSITILCSYKHYVYIMDMQLGVDITESNDYYYTKTVIVSMSSINH